jgi:hypothetical protein
MNNTPKSNNRPYLRSITVGYDQLDNLIADIGDSVTLIVRGTKHCTVFAKVTPTWSVMLRLKYNLSVAKVRPGRQGLPMSG